MGIGQFGQQPFVAALNCPARMSSRQPIVESSHSLFTGDSTDGKGTDDENQDQDSGSNIYLKTEAVLDFLVPASLIVVIAPCGHA